MAILAVIVVTSACEYVAGIRSDRLPAECNEGQRKCDGNAPRICSSGLAWVPDPDPGAADSCSTHVTRVKEVAAGGRLTCALKEDETVWCWGGNNQGGLGIGQSGNTLLHSPIPMQVKDDTGKGTLQGVISLASGYQHACAVTSDGSVWCWGGNGDGQLGNGSSLDSSLPVRVLGPQGSGFLGSATSVSCGQNQTCAVTADRTLYCWGADPLGAGGLTGSWIPVKVPVSNVEQAALSALGTICARGVNMGSLYCWGHNSYGEVGNGTKDSLVATPFEVRSMITEVRLGYDHACAIDVGVVLCWGADYASQLGIGPTDTCSFSTPCSTTPVHALGPSGAGWWPSKVVGLAAGEAFTCALTLDDSVYCWGAGASGRLGNGSTSNRVLAVQVLGVGGAGVLAAKKISIGANGVHACALRADGTVACWGSNTSGQLGDGTFLDQSAPVLVPPF